MRFIVLLIMLASIMDCTLLAQKKTGRRAEKKQRELMAVQNAISKDSLVIQIDKIRPSFAANVNEQSYYGYTGHVLKLIDNKFSENFIYIGEAPTAMMGEERLSIYAKEQETPFAKRYDAQKEMTYYYLKFRNESEENKAEWECFIEIQKNGNTHIQMQTKELNPMIYSGFLDIENIYGNK